MAMTVRAVYEGGVLRPVQPLALAEGETVELTIASTRRSGPPSRAPTPAEEDYARRIRAAQSQEELDAIMATAPPSPEDTVDLVARLNESRRLTGFRMPDPEPAGEERP